MSGASFVDDTRAAAETALDLAFGAVVAHAFANFYVITTRPEEPIVRRVNIIKGRPPDQVGSVLTTRSHIGTLFDWAQLPEGLTPATVRELIDELYELGPFGFRGPAASHMPGHLTFPDAGVRTTQIIAPGYRCPSNRFLDQAMSRLPEPYLYVTSANRSRHQTGADDEPAHFEADGLEAEFGHEPSFRMLRHRDESAARAAYPNHAPMSTTILAFHKLVHGGGDGLKRLVVERHGSLHVGDLRPILARFGFGLVLGPKAVKRLALRDYSTRKPEEVAA
jgi:tRNA A37 threonylcarbamoyladenosine synthetase subunit TsaC/SUA5/YrdC